MRGSDWEPLPTALIIIGIWLLIVAGLGYATIGK